MPHYTFPNQKLAQSTWNLANLMCLAAREHLFTTVLVSNDERQELGIVKDWAGGEPPKDPSKPPSRAPIIGPMKVMELLMDLSEPFAMSPASGRDLTSGYLGGVRRKEGYYQYLTSGSAWEEKCDAMFALVLNFAMSNMVHLHHVGHGYGTEDEMMAAVHADEQRYNVRARNVPAPDHTRFYVEVDAPHAPDGVYWIEHQWGPGVIKPGSTHWDLATVDAKLLLDFVGDRLGGKELWGDTPNSPYGVVWQMNRNDRPFGIMARSDWWVID